jgi:Na+-transporting methylmalonyl-CoA/oxaloacetate decarboxylase gamma subunit
MRIVGFLVALIIVVWVVGSLVNLYTHRARGRDSHQAPIDEDDVRRRLNDLDDVKLRNWRDDLPPW